MSIADVAKWEDHLLAVLSSDRFRNMDGLGGEVPLYIYPYAPEDALEIADSRKRITTRLSQRGVDVLDINLYDLTVELLTERGAWDQLIEMEPTIDKEDLREGLRSMVDPGDDLVPAIEARLATHPSHILFVTGIGEVFPFIRSHTVLNNLESIASRQPTLMFFPGSYEQSDSLGSTLVLFGTVGDDNYYRAKDIREQEA